MNSIRLILVSIVTATLIAPLASAPRGRFDYYLTGSKTDVGGNTEPGIGLRGGGTDVDALFEWMSARAGGGDLVVIRASGADGYNQYVFGLGDFDSVETLVLSNQAASNGSIFDIPSWDGSGGTAYTLNVEASAISSSQGSIY